MLKNIGKSRHEGLPDFGRLTKQAGTKSCLTAGRLEVVYEGRPFLSKISSCQVKRLVSL
jgi:hypothetical protein